MVPILESRHKLEEALGQVLDCTAKLETEDSSLNALDLIVSAARFTEVLLEHEATIARHAVEYAVQKYTTERTNADKALELFVEQMRTEAIADARATFDAKMKERYK